MFSSRKSFIDKLREKLLDPKHPGIREKILQNHQIEASRLFDGLPEEFDTIFEEEKPNVDKLCQILMRIKSNNTELTDKGPLFTKSTDMAAIKSWATSIIKKASEELLTDNNTIKQEVLDLVGHTDKTLTCHNLLCAYFSIASQYIINLLYHSSYADKIMADVFQAFIEYMNKYPIWVDEIIKDRVVSKREEPSFWTDDEYTLERNLTGAAALGLLFFGGMGIGLAAYSASQERKNKDSEQQHSENKPTSDWYKL
jgi:ribosomal protein S17E